MKKCKECGREEWGYFSVLNEEGYCPRCAIVHYEEKIKKLQGQIREANEIIANFRTYDFTRDDEIAEEYQVKYGIAGEKIYITRTPSNEFERWRKNITKSLKKKLKGGA